MASKSHAELVKKAEDAINAVFSDTKVDRAQTMESMIDLRNVILENMSVLKATDEDEED